MVIPLEADRNDLGPGTADLTLPVLSFDVSLLLNMSISRLSSYVIGHERETGQLIPRRGTIHDMGPSVTHKAIICYKSLVEKKPTSQVALETFHSPEDVEHYVQCFRRIQLCRDKGLSLEETAQATGLSLSPWSRSTWIS